MYRSIVGAGFRGLMGTYRDQRNFTRHTKQSRRQVAIGLALAVIGPTTSPFAGPLDSVALDSQSTILHGEQETIVPAGGAVGADLSLTGRAFLSVDFVVQPNKQLSLLIIDASQKNQLNSGVAFQGRPLIRSAIDGTASVEIGAPPGTYYCAFLNDDDTPTMVDYRVSARPY